MHHQAVAIHAQVPQRERRAGGLAGLGRHSRSSLARSSALHATAQLSEKLSRSTVSALGVHAVGAAAAGICRGSVLRPAIGPTAMRYRSNRTRCRVDAGSDDKLEVDAAIATAQCRSVDFRRDNVRQSFIHPGKSTQNAFVESSNGKFRE